MGIYRGAGGSGDAVNDASSEALITLQARDAALAAQAAAEAARDAALLAETNAETAEANAELAEANAEAAEAGVAASAAAAAASASSASSSASSASTSASNASTSASNAAASESAASTHASDALASATNAAASAVAASTSAANAESSASDALAAQLAAEAALDQFDDTYLGAKSSNPTVDNDGNPLTTGDQYFNTVANELRIWNGSSWQAASTVGGTVSSLTVTGAFAANGSTTIGDAAGDSVTINASTVSTPNGLTVNGTVIPASKTLVVTTDIGSTVQAYDADTAKYDDVTANFTGTLQNGGSNVVVDSDIGVTVQAYDAQLADVAGLTPSDNNFIVGNGTNFVTESGSTARTSLGLGSIATQDANNVAVTGGSINGITIGASTASSGAFTTLSATGDVTIADKIVHSGDTDTAVRFPAADTVTVETSGAERLRIDSSGNVGIGTNSPTNKLSVVGSDTSVGRFAGASYGLTMNSDAGVGFRIEATDPTGVASYQPLITNGSVQIYRTGNSERMRIDSSGNVMIGTASTLNSAAGRGSLSINGSSDSIVAFGNGGSVSGYLYSYSTGLELTTVGSRNLVFQTSNTERMRIDTSGNVNIGTTGIAEKLVVAGAVVSAGQLQSLRTSSTTLDYNVDNLGRIIATGPDASTYPAIVFANTTTTTYAERMRIDSSGNLGLGTNSPSARLTVSGAGRFIGGSNNLDIGQTGSIGYVETTGSTATPITFWNSGTERMRIDSSGNLCVGTTAALNSSSGRGNITINGSSDSIINFGIGGSVSAYLFSTSGALEMNAAGSRNLTFVNNSAERMRIDSSGNVLVGRTSVTGTNCRLNVQLAGTTASGYTAASNAGISLDAGTATNGVINLVGGAELGVYRSNSSGAYDVGIGFGDNSNRILRFDTAGSERMRITSGGDVGIGTSSPVYRLNVSVADTSNTVGGSAAAINITNSNSGAFGRTADLDFSVGGGTVAEKIAGLSAVYTNYSTSVGGALAFCTNNGSSSYAERMRITSSGDVGIGTTSPSQKFHVSGGYSLLNGLRISGADTNNTIYQASGDFSLSSDGGNVQVLVNPAGAYFRVLTGGQNERMRITSSGELLVGTTSNTDSSRFVFSNSSGRAGQILQNATGSWGLTVDTPNNFTDTNYLARNNRTSGFDQFNFLVCQANAANRATIRGDGNMYNTNGTYAAYSDAKLKENIVDATPKLDKINQLQVRNYNLIGDELKQIGFIAQEFEQVFPSMVEEHPDKDANGNDLGTTTKSIKISVLIPILVKAMQEQQAIINELKTRIETLENK